MIVKIFDRNEEYRAEAEVFNFRHLHEINRLDVLTGYTLEPIDKGEKILYQHRTGKWYEFIVDSPEIIHEEGTQYHFTAINSLVEIDGDWIEDKRPSTLSAAVVSILEPTRWTMGNVTNKPDVGLTFYRVTAREALDILLESYPVEFQTRIEVGTSGVVTRTLDVLDRIGGDYGKRFVYNRDLTSVKRTYRQGKVVTALYGFGKGEEVGDGFGRRIDFSSVNNGYAYVYNPSILAEYGRLENGVRKHVFDSVVYDDVEDKNKVLQLTQEEYAKRCRPQVSYEGTAVDLGLEHEQVGIGDTVKVIDGDHRFETRINYLMENEDFQNEVRLANYIMNITDSNNALIKKVGELATNAGVWDEAQKIVDGSYMDGLIDKLNGQANASGGWTFIKEGEGLLTINAPTEDTATKAVNIVGGTVRVASQKNPNGTWKWRTFITGDEIAADMISTGILSGGMVHWNLDTGVLYIGDNPETASFYWDGSNLKLNVNELKIQSKDVATEESVGGAIDSATSPLITRISQAESKITPTAITDTVSEATDQDGEPLFAKTSEVKLTVDEWTAKFSQIGGRNLLRSSKVNLSNSSYPTGTFYMVEPMEEGETYTITVWGSLGANKENFALYLNGGSIRLTYLEKMKAGMYQATFKGVSGGVEDFVHVFAMPQAVSTVSKITHIQLEKGSVGTDWSPAPEEFYEGIVKIDLDGIEVGVSNSTIKTLFQHDGMRIVDITTGNDIAKFTADGGNIDELTVKKVRSPHVVNKIGVSRNYYVYSTATGDGSGRNESNRASSVQDALRSALDDAIVIEKNAQININISGAINEDISINGISGHGRINILGAYGSTRVTGRIYVQNTPCPVYINGVTFISVEEGSQLVYSSGLCNVFCEAVRIDGANQSRGFRAENGAIIRVEASPVVNCTTAYFADYMSTIYTYDTYGQGNAVVADARKMSRIGLHYRHPNGTAISQSYNGGEVQVQGTATGSSFSYTPPVWSTISKTFVAELETSNASSGYVWRTGTWTQGSWDGQAHKGTADFGTRIKEFLEGSGGFQNISNVVIRARRNKSSGRSNPVSLKVTSPTTLTLPAVTFGASSQANANAAIITAMQSGSLKLQSSTTSSSDYAGFDRIEITFSVQKKV